MHDYSSEMVLAKKNAHNLPVGVSMRRLLVCLWTIAHVLPGG